MHELSICQNLIRQVSSIAQSRQAKQVKKIHITVGPLSGIEPSLLEQIFPLAKIDTVVQDAELEVTETPIEVSCTHCGKYSQATLQDLRCRFCHSWHTAVTSGDEMVLSSVELILNED